MFGLASTLRPRGHPKKDEKSSPSPFMIFCIAETARQVGVSTSAISKSLAENYSS